MEPLAPHEKVFVLPEFATEDIHGDMGCHECHGGDPSDGDMLTAHDGVVRDPSYPVLGSVCEDCHPEIAETASQSLHATLAPYESMITARASHDPEVLAEVNAGRETHCNACHASCGQCHVSRPAYVGGGLLAGHFFEGKPPMREVCTACHGSRVEREYFGKNEGIPPDVHWRKRFMECASCHSGEEMHGSAPNAMSRYDAPNAPTCVGCHQDIYAPDAANAEQHELHRDLVSCHVCHAMPYKNCWGCHFALDDHGFPFFRNDESYQDFVVGLNPLASESRPERFVVLRHVPVAEDSFRFYVDGGLSNYSALPTWKMATPHTIQRRTPQNESCGNCHDNHEWFLQQDNVRPEEQAANQGVIVGQDMLPMQGVE